VLGIPEASQSSSDTMCGVTTSDKRQLWERQWQRRRGEDFHWYLSEAPTELIDLLNRPDRPTGAALDLGCGNGVATAYLDRHFDLAVGIDIAHAATRQAMSMAQEEGTQAKFVVAEAPVLPFRDGAFGLVFDRGCLQAIPKESWPKYFGEVERLLAPGGVLQLYVSKPARRRPRILSLRGLRAWLRHSGSRAGGPSFLSPPLVRRLMPTSMRELALNPFEFRTSAGTTRRFLYGLFRKD
jgi:SAM-dependent methyltransferase